jgi:hypothetical protein
MSKPLCLLVTNPKLNSDHFYTGYVPVKDSKGKVWWSYVDVPNANKREFDGTMCIETEDAFYKVRYIESFTDEMKESTMRYLPSLQNITIRKEETGPFGILRGYDHISKSYVEGVMYKETDDWYDIVMVPGSKNSGRIRYLK